jgi:DNA-binding transcriptional ArsR family regulator
MGTAVTTSVAATAYEPAAELLQALGFPLRIEILVALSRGELCVHELVLQLGGAQRLVSQPLVSQHLRVLRTARLVAVTKRGKENVYRLLDQRVQALVEQAILLAGPR